MQFYPPDAPVSEGMRTEEFLLRPLTAAHNPLDYEAVMASQQKLRLLGTGEWPRPDFTPEENLVDLEGHEADFHARRGFTYTVQDPSGTRCLGCVYFYPLDQSLRRVGADEAASQVGDHEAVAWFWVRPDGVPADLDRRLLVALLQWLGNDFAFKRVLFRTWAADERQPALLSEAGLRLASSSSEGDTQALYYE